VARPIACFRRTGKNNSVVNSARAKAECELVLRKFGPNSEIERQFWKYVLKLWFNIVNPGWLLHKTTRLVPARLRLQEQIYF
jgi:hypothetical protein